MSDWRARARRLAPVGLDRPAVAYLILSMVLGVGGQVLLKLAAADLRAVSGGLASPLRLVGAILVNPGLLGGLALYGSGTFFWLLALSRVDLGLLYPYTALNFVLVLAPAALVLQERIGPVRLIGVLLIALGVGLHALSARRGAGGPAAPAPTGEDA
ncbi:MAG: EamA family transporter [Candidatus Krumholzibacteriia bacterium]